MSDNTQPYDFKADSDGAEPSNLPVRSFPKSKGEMLAARLNNTAASLNAAVEDALLANMEDPDVKAHLEAWDDAQSVTGKCMYDDFKAAERIQQLSEGITVITDVKTSVILRALNVVLRRFGQTRKQRIATAQMAAEASARAQGLAGE